MLDLDELELEAVKEILRHHLQSGVEVFAYGSRTKQEARRFSDLDLIIKTKMSLSLTAIAGIQEAFSESDLPFRTDLSDWDTMSLEFQQHIEKDMIQIY